MKVKEHIERRLKMKRKKRKKFAGYQIVSPKFARDFVKRMETGLRLK
jgi:hypothetical protein